MNQKLDFDIPIEKLGYPGSKGQLSVVLQIENDTRTDEERLGDMNPRTFALTGFLSKGVSNLEEYTIDPEAESGVSFISVHPRLKKIKVETKGQEFELHKNEKNQISTIRLSCLCRNVNEAFTEFYKSVMPLIDHLSFICDIPIFLDRIIAVDQKNDIFYSTYTVPYVNVNLDQYSEVLAEEMRPIFALYREGKNSGSNYYKFLCYYKILEGIYDFIRPMTFKQAKRLGIDLKGRKETVPKHKVLVEKHPKHIGKSVMKLFKGLFRKGYRNAIAHFSTKDGSPFIVSDHKRSIDISNNITLIEFCCREVIDNQLALRKQLEKLKSNQ